MTKLALTLLAPLALGFLPTGTWAATPSFDCAKASHEVELLICKDAELAELDNSLSSLYRVVLKHTPASEQKRLKAEQRGWVKGRDDCWKDSDMRGCVLSEYRTRIDALKDRGQSRASWQGPASATPGTPTLAEQGCLRDVTRTTNNGDVVLLSSSFSQAGTEVIVGVGPQRARWRCIGYEDGTTADIMSLTDEGRL